MTGFMIAGILIVSVVTGLLLARKNTAADVAYPLVERTLDHAGRQIVRLEKTGGTVRCIYVSAEAHRALGRTVGLWGHPLYVHPYLTGSKTHVSGEWSA